MQLLWIFRLKRIFRLKIKLYNKQKILKVHMGTICLESRWTSDHCKVSVIKLIYTVTIDLTVTVLLKSCNAVILSQRLASKVANVHKEFWNILDHTLVL